MRTYHEPSVGLRSDWRTPPEYFEKLGLVFDVDVASPGLDKCWVPAKRCFTIEDDGLRQPWPPGSLIFMNPPFGGRNAHVPWLVKFLDHANGVAIVRAYTSSGWFHQHVVPRAELLCFPRGKTQFIRPDGSIGKEPGHGAVLIGMGEVATTALLRSGLGFCARIHREADAAKIEAMVSVLEDKLPELVTIAFTRCKAELHLIVPGLTDDEWERLVREENQRRVRAKP